MSAFSTPSPSVMANETSDPTQTTASTPMDSRTSISSQRSMKQLGLFFAGAGFLSLSTLITRRAVVRKRIATIPPFYTQSNQPSNKMGTDGSLMAFEALNLATLNVIGFGIMATGGLSWAFDVTGIDDLRAMTRRHIGPPGARTDEAIEQEIEEWVAKVLLKRDGKDEGKAKNTDEISRKTQ